MEPIHRSRGFIRASQAGAKIQDEVMAQNAIAQVNVALAVDRGHGCFIGPRDLEDSANVECKM